MRMLIRPLLLLSATLILTRLAASVVSRRFAEGSEVSDEVRRMTVLGGLDYTSRAGGLRSAEIGLVLGGARVDLRDATLDPAGATVLLENTLGGLVLLVRDDWAVSVDHAVVGGGETRIEVTPPAELPDDAPRLHVQVLTRLGGTVITSDPAA